MGGGIFPAAFYSIYVVQDVWGENVQDYESTCRLQQNPTGFVDFNQMGWGFLGIVSIVLSKGMCYNKTILLRCI